ncbi:MAG: metallophosphoesterase [Actinomycetota bacterium]
MFVWIALILVLVAVLCIAYGVFIERSWYRLVRYRLNILPAGQHEPLDILHLSDLHFVRNDKKKIDFLSNLPKADIAVITGDLLGEPEAVETAVAALRPVRGLTASYFVLGSNDYFVPRPLNYFRYFFGPRRGRKATVGRARELVDHLEAGGWVHLANARAEISMNGFGVEIAGIDDPHIHRPDLRSAGRRSPDRLGLAIVHSPDPAPELVALGYDLVVAGHTHGGQVRLPWIGALVNNCMLPRSMSKGLIRMGNGLLHVSPGLGTSKYAPFRFLCPPEATLLEIRPSTRPDRSSAG